MSIQNENVDSLAVDAGRAPTGQSTTLVETYLPNSGGHSAPNHPLVITYPVGAFASTATLNTGNGLTND